MRSSEPDERPEPEHEPELVDDLAAHIAELDRAAWNLPPARLDGSRPLHRAEREWRLGLSRTRER
jgi:hypothetical protein